jgi:pyruvate/2-oxoglutarate dehydrogenase complex dihydrolipoamide dehydrogenase (E3) component
MEAQAMSSFVEELKNLNKQANKYKQVEASKDEAVKKAQEQLDIVWAKNQIEKIKSKARKVALRGKKELRVGKIEIHDGHSGKYLNLAGRSRPDKLSIAQLRGKWYWLATECEALGLRLNVFWTYDGGGVSDWYEFWVEWD